MACFPPATYDPNTVYLGPCGKCGQYHGSWQPCIDLSQVTFVTAHAGRVLCDTCQTPMTVQKMKVTSTTTGTEQDMYFYKCPQCKL